MKEEYLDKLRQLKAEYGATHKVADGFCFFDKETEDTVDDGFMCNHCEFVCDSEMDFINHLKVEHKDNMRVPEDKVVDRFTNGDIVKKYHLDAANPHLNYGIEEFDDKIVGFIGANCNYYCNEVVVQKDNPDVKPDYHYKSNVQQKYLKVKIKEVLDEGIPNKDVYAWLQTNGKYSIRYKAEKRLDF